MQEFEVKVNTIEKVKEFVILNSKQKFDIEIVSGRYIVDAKSIMGLFSLDCSKSIKVIAHSENTPEYREYFNKTKAICDIK